jgi:hypothetical protein
VLLIIWLIVWLIQGTPHIVFWEPNSWAIALYVCAAISILVPRSSGLGWRK